MIVICVTNRDSQVIINDRNLCDKQEFTDITCPLPSSQDLRVLLDLVEPLEHQDLWELQAARDSGEIWVLQDLQAPQVPQEQLAPWADRVSKNHIDDILNFKKVRLQHSSGAPDRRSTSLGHS